MRRRTFAARTLVSGASGVVSTRAPLTLIAREAVADTRLPPFAISADRPGWTVIGPGGGREQFNPTVSPHDSRRVLVSCDMTGAYLTEDRGRSWKALYPPDARTRSMAIMRKSAAWRSTDSGATWSRIPAYDFKWGPPRRPDPADPARIYIATFGGSVFVRPA
jgi:hypothetical protein